MPQTKTKENAKRKWFLNQKNDRGPGTNKTDEPVKSMFTEQTWSTVVGRKAKKAQKKPTPQQQKKFPIKTTANSPQKASKAQNAKNRVRSGKPPRTAAITVTSSLNGLTYAEIIMRARTHIKLSELGISEVKPKRAIIGGLILEIPSENREEQATKLTERMRDLFRDENVRVTKPTKMSELRI